MEIVSQKISETKEDETKKREEMVKGVISKLEKKDYNIFIYTPAMNTPSGGISVLFKHAQTLKEAGYNVKIVYEPKQNSKADRKSVV